MPRTYTSPFASSFNAAIKRGGSYNTAVQNIASRTGKSPEFVWDSLHKAGHCFRQKFNGKYIYFPWNVKKANSTTWKNSQVNSWQWFCEWCLIHGIATPDQFNNHTGSQKDFMSWCRKFFGRQFNWTTTKSGRGKSAGSKSSRGKSYKFPSSKRGSSSRRYRRAA